MKKYMTFSYHDVFEGLMHSLPGAEVKEATQPYPIKPSPADGPAALMVAVSENMSATLIITPAISKEELVTSVTTPTASLDEPANPPTPQETTGDVRSPTELNIQNGSKYIHLAQQPLWGVFPPTQETSGSATTTVAPVGRKELGAALRMNSRPS